MLCKNCKKPIEITLIGLKSFCSHECKKAHRKAYKANWMRQNRGVDISGGYSSINSQNVDTVKPHEKPIEKAENQGHGLSEGNFPNFLLKTIKEGEDIAKKFCSEFKRKRDKGYCLISGLPHEIECKACINYYKRELIK